GPVTHGVIYMYTVTPSTRRMNNGWRRAAKMTPLFFRGGIFRGASTGNRRRRYYIIRQNHSGEVVRIREE
ncbi:MAG: hypothetical protein PHQ27_06835, partial [Victivallales bacterium]|nr:hypothetical protein [Victivallales bacterium]